MGKVIERARQVVGIASGLAIVIGLRFTWGEATDPRLQRVTVLGLPIFDRARLNARRAQKLKRRGGSLGEVD